MHRIGQIKPVTGQSTIVGIRRYQLAGSSLTLTIVVKTLAIKSTMEEMMVSRRAALQSQTEKVSRNWAEESGMRQFIAVSHSPITEKKTGDVF